MMHKQAQLIQKAWLAGQSPSALPGVEVSRLSGVGSHALPMMSHSVAAGFPSPADDHVEARISLDETLVEHPDATFYLRVKGDSMVGADIHDNDVLVVDRAIAPRHGHIVVAVLDGELTVKTLQITPAGVRLVAANEHYPAIEVREAQELVIWGVVLWTIKRAPR